MVIDCGAYAGGRRIGDVSLDEIGGTLAQEGVFVWLRLFEPDEALMKQVQEKFGLHDLAVEDAHRAHQRPKLEAYGDAFFVVLQNAQLLKDTLHFGETHIFVGQRYVVTVRHGVSPSLEPVRARCERNPEQLAQGPGCVLYAVSDFVVDSYLLVVDHLEDHLAVLEEAVLVKGRMRRTTQELYAMKRNLTGLRRVVIPLSDIFAQLLHNAHPLIHDDARPYYRDVADHVARIRERTELMREMLDTALHVNLALVTITQNDVMKKLAGWAALLAVPTLVASYYGMNFKHMPELEWKYGYPAVIAIIIALCVLLHRKLRRAGWL
jgi:magnesium transporter